MSCRDWRKDDGRLVGPYGVPEEFLTQREKDQIDGKLHLDDKPKRPVEHRGPRAGCPLCQPLNFSA